MVVDARKIAVRDAITIDRERSVRSAASFMNYFKVDSLIVLDDDYPVGMLSRKDIPGNDLDMRLVGEVMSEPLIWVRYNDTLTEVAEIMEEEGVKRLPIFGNLSSGPVLLGMYVYEDEIEETLEI